MAFLTCKNESRAPQADHEVVGMWVQSVYQQYSSALYGYALALTGSIEDAQDAVQEVFSRISRDSKRFTEVEHVSAYLFSATRNAAYSTLRGRQRCETLHEAICLDLAMACSSSLKPISATLISIRTAFDQLSIEQREVLVLKILHQMTFKEIAEVAKVSINTIAGRYRYGIEKLRIALDDPSIQ
jgi:RNA polymerase sigma-70 factor (ECF subfamily)